MPQSTDSSYPWLNTVQYPFATRQFDTGEGWISYVDHGQGRPIVFLHGNPTWSYLYRNLIQQLGSTYRCIAPDMLGYGLSDKPQDVDYRPQAQAQRFAALMEYLDLDDVTIVVQCAGGPIGLSWALDHPERVRDFVIFNTWLWPMNENHIARKLAQLVGNPLNRIYYKIIKATPRFLLPSLFADRHRISRASQTQFLLPFQNYLERGGLYSMIFGLVRSTDWFQGLWNRRQILANKRALILWGMKDPMLTEDYMHLFQQMFPRHETIPFSHRGRFIPEEVPDKACEEIRWFLMNHTANNDVAVQLS